MGISWRPGAVWLGVCFVVALVVHGAFNYRIVFQNGFVNFQEADSWFHMRTVENLLHHFPYRSGFDPYSGMPEGQPVSTGPFFDYAIALTAWIVGLGSPGESLTRHIGAWFPAVLGSLVTIPVFLLGRSLFHPVAGAAAAAVLAVMPGNFFSVSRLGYADHHVAEVLFSALALLFLVLSLERRQLSHMACYVALTGIALGLFLSTRTAGGFLIGFITIWALLQYCASQGREESESGPSPWIVTVPAFAIAWLLFLPSAGIIWSNFTMLALAGGMAAISVAALLSRLVRSRALYIVALVLVGVAGVAVYAAARSTEFHALLLTLKSRAEAGPALTVSEMRPLLTMNGVFAINPAWSQLTSAWFFAVPALVAIVIAAFRRSAPAWNLFAIWSTLTLVAGFAQNRMVVYFAAPAAILTGYAVWRILDRFQDRWRKPLVALLALVLIVPNTVYSYYYAQVDIGMPPEWRESLDWLRTQTPEPFGDPETFNRYFPRLANGARFTYPESAYGVMSWWDYGHWISALAHRIPVSNGMQTNAEQAARFFLAQDPPDAALIMRRMKARYVMADSMMAGAAMNSPTAGRSKFHAMPVWAGENDPFRYTETYRLSTDDGSPRFVTVFYPDYYRSMFARLFLFDGAGVEPSSSTWVIRFSERAFPAVRLRQRTIITSQRFDTYQEARQFIDRNNNGELVLAGLDPGKSCVPLEKVEEFRTVHVSKAAKSVKIFEYSGK